MSQQHRDSEKGINEEKPSQNCSSSFPKSTSVINQLKTKVRRKSKVTTLDQSDSGSNVSLNNVINNTTTKRTSPEEIDLIRPQPTTVNELRSTPLETIFSYDGTDPDQNSSHEIMIENEENVSFTASPAVATEKEDLEQNIQWRSTSISIDTNPKRSSSKVKTIQSAKSLPETNSTLTTKKRRQTIRRTGFQIRDEDFQTIFNDLPSDEQLVIGFPAAWRRDVFMHGRMFLTVNNLCFYTCFFKWEESLCLAFKDIVSVTREKSSKLLPSAIRIQMKNDQRYFFTSTLPRERIFITIFRVWQNALLEQPSDYQQLRAVISADQQSLDESTEDSEESVNLENNTTEIRQADLQSQSLPVMSNRSTESMRPSMTINRRVVSLPSEDENANYISSCNCESHLTRTYAERSFTLNVDTLFELLFSDNSFTQNFHNAQKLTDYNYGEWRLNKQTGFRERQVTYNTAVQSILGTNALSCRERQILEVERPKLIYVLSSEVYNEGMKYTDAFYVATKFCMIQRDARHSSLRATAEVRYTKNVNGFIKTFIEKNAYASIEQGVNEQVRRLEAQQVNRRSVDKSLSSTKYNKQDSRNGQSSVRRKQSKAITSANSNPLIQDRTISGKGYVYDILLIAGIFLLLLHFYLCYKLYSFDQNVPKLDTLCFSQCLQTCHSNNMNKGCPST